MSSSEDVQLCTNCHDRLAGKCIEISFLYKGMKVSIFKNGITCKECCEEKWREEFEEFVQGFIDISGERLKVDWSAYCESLSILPEHRSKINKLLRDIGVLSFWTQGNWELMAEGDIMMNPRAYELPLFFTQKEDVQELALTQYGNSNFNWEIRHIDKVISKQEIISSVVNA